MRTWLQLLDQSLGYRLTLVTGAPESGKNRILHLWARETMRSVGYHVLWLDISQRDNDPWQLCLDMHTTLSAFPGITLPDWNRPAYRELLACLADLLNPVSMCNIDFSLVLNHYQHIEAPASHQLVARMLDYLPACMHVIIASPTNPPLPLARWRARRQVLELEIPPQPPQI